MAKLMRPFSVLLFALALAIYFKYFHMQPGKKAPELQVTQEEIAPEPMEQNDKEEINEVAKSLKENGEAAEAENGPEQWFNPPRLADMKGTEEAGNEHLLAFAKQVSVQMEKAEKSFELAKPTLAKLAECAEDRNSEYPVSIRATCYINAEKLNQAHSGAFGQDISELEGKLSPRVQTVIHALKATPTK